MNIIPNFLKKRNIPVARLGVGFCAVLAAGGLFAEGAGLFI